MKVVVVGLGPIGVEVARAVIARPELRLVALVDSSPSLIGAPFSSLWGAAPLPQAALSAADLGIEGSLDEVLRRGGVDAVALCTASRVDAIASDVVRAVAAGAHVVTTCEELASPPLVAGSSVGEGSPSPTVEHIDAAARLTQVTVVATGVNPGFVMDRLPLELADACVRVDRVQVERVVDAQKRREPLRRKIGHGLTVEAFARGVAERRLGHVGLRASAELLARGLRTSLARTDESIDPVLDAAGVVLGIKQRFVADTRDGRSLELRLQMSVGAPEPHDRVLIDGDPPLDVRIDGGVHGDRATVGAVLSALRKLPRAPRGLVTVVELYG